MAGSLTVQGLLTGTTAGTVQIGPFTLVPNTSGFFEATETTLVSGANTIDVPSWAKFCAIIPPTTNTIALTLKGLTGDEGILLSKTVVTVLSFPSSPSASFVLTAATTTAAPTTVIFT